MYFATVSIYQKVDSWVRTKMPESVFLDYKRELNFNSEKDKIELAKDISSFANTQGGCLIYGVDEERQDHKSVPVPKEQYGIAPIRGNIIDIENILTSIISPQLPYLRIRVIPLQHDESKVVYLLWHSKSWCAPHMVSGYKHSRFYKRGNFKAEPMHEHEIEAKYRERLSTISHVKDYINKVDYGLYHLNPSPCFLKIAVAPLYFSEDSKYFSYKEAVNLISNHRQGDPISFLDGIAYINRTRHFIIKYLFNAIITICYDIQSSLQPKEKEDISYKLIDPARIIWYVKTIMPFITHFYNNISFRAPIILKLSINNSNGILLKNQMGPLYVDDMLSGKDLADYI